MYIHMYIALELIMAAMNLPHLSPLKQILICDTPTRVDICQQRNTRKPEALKRCASQDSIQDAV